MAIIAPTVTAIDLHDYRAQMERAVSFAECVHVDLMDGIFAPTKSPDIDALWLPTGKIRKDMHVMFQHPFHQLKKLLRLGPDMIIIQVEADKESVDNFVKHIKKTRVRLGVALLAPTRPTESRVAELIKKADYVLIFSGHLGYQGSKSDLGLLSKVEEIKSINPNAEIGWDGGICLENARKLADGGVNVLNIGGAIQKSADPLKSYKELSAALA
jgi:pentose-5-phosphate-3-epimerase